MSTGKRPTFHLQSENIQQWQISTCEDDELALPTATISALYNSIVGFLKVVIDNVRKNEPCPSYFSTLEQAVAALFFWGRDFGVPQGELDTALQFSNRLRDTVLTILASLGDLSSLGLVRIITTDAERKALLRTTKLVSLTDDAKLLLDEPLEPASYEEDNIDRLCVTLHNMIDSLKILGSSLDFVADDEIDDEESKVWNQLQDRAAHEYFADLISSRFPLASIQLVQSLGQSNWDRYNYLTGLRGNAIEESDVISGEKALSEFHDSGIGTSAAQSSLGRETRSEYAATVVSSRAESSHKRLPPLPEAGRSGEAFECEVCNRKVQIQRTREWKKHVFQDICAYTCVFPECFSLRVLFGDRKSMTHHLASHHDIPDTPRAHSCPLCLEEIVGDRDIVSLHFARHMEEIALGILPQSTESDDGSEQSDDGEVGMLLSTVPGMGSLDVPIEPSAGVALVPEYPSPDFDFQDHRANNSDSVHTQAQDLDIPESAEGYVIACLCGSREDDGSIVLCEECNTWQHILCFYKSTQSVPDVHLCVDCNPREIDPTLMSNTRKRLIERKQLRRDPQRSRTNPNKASGFGKTGDDVSLRSENSRQSVDPYVPVNTYASGASVASVASLPPLSQLNIPRSANTKKDNASNSKGTPATEQRIPWNASQLLDPSVTAQKRAHPCVNCFNIHVDCDKGYPSCGGCIARNLECWPRATSPAIEDTKYEVPALPNEDRNKSAHLFGETDLTHQDYLLLADLRDDKGLTWEQIADFFPGRSPEVLRSFYGKKLGTRQPFDTLNPIVGGDQYLKQTDQLPSIGELVSKQELPSIREAQVMAEMQQAVRLPPFHQITSDFDVPPSIRDDRTSRKGSLYESWQIAYDAVVPIDQLADGQRVSAAQELRDGEKRKQPVSPAERQLEGAVAEAAEEAERVKKEVEMVKRIRKEAEEAEKAKKETEFSDGWGPISWASSKKMKTTKRKREREAREKQKREDQERAERKAREAETKVQRVQQEPADESFWRQMPGLKRGQPVLANLSEIRSASRPPSLPPLQPEVITVFDDTLPGVTQGPEPTANATADIPKGKFSMVDMSGQNYHYNLDWGTQLERPTKPHEQSELIDSGIGIEDSET